MVQKKKDMNFEMFQVLSKVAAETPNIRKKVRETTQSYQIHILKNMITGPYFPNITSGNFQYIAVNINAQN